MFDLDYITKEEVKEHNTNWPEIAEHPYRLLIAGGSGFGKTNALLSLINYEPDIDKNFIYMLMIHMRKISIVNYQKRKYMLY